MLRRLKRLNCNLCNFLNDAPWEYTEEPHASRRNEILKKHPEIKELMGSDHSITYIVLAEVFIQICMFWVVHDMAWGPLFLLSYAVGGTLNHSLAAAMHEIAHNLAYGHDHPYWNKALGIIINLPLGVPIYIFFKKTHSDHHRYLLNPEKDIALPPRFESFFFVNPISRILYLILNPFFQILRPFSLQPVPVEKLEIVNAIVQIAFDVAIVYYFGVKSLIYSIAGTALGFGLHPLAGHFLAAHYMFTDGLATVSCYCPLNIILFNLGYHVEHHDFPYIPWRKLPEVRRIAPEFYNELPHHTSWLWVMLTFIISGPQDYSLQDMLTMTKNVERQTVSAIGRLTPRVAYKSSL